LNFRIDNFQKVVNSTANLSRIEQGRYSVGLDILSKIAFALGAKIELVDFIEPEKS